MRFRQSSILSVAVVFVGVGCHGSQSSGNGVNTMDLPGQDREGALVDNESGRPDTSRDDAVENAMPDEVLADTAPVDPGPLDTGPADPGTEPGPDLATPDTGTFDQGIPDLITPDAPLPEDPIFRAFEFTVVQPDFCLQPGGGGCSVNTAMVNAYLASAIVDASDPLNLLLRLVPFEVGNSLTDLFLGGGPCKFVGEAPIACAFSVSAAPVVFEGPLFLPDGCGPPGHLVPCFETAPEKVEMWFMGLFIAMHEARVSGRIESGAEGFRITHGTLEGFVPVNTTKSLQIALPGGPIVTLYDLVKHNPVVDLAGVKTFRFEFRYQADALAYLD